MSDEQLIKTPGLFGETQNFLLERELGRGGMGGVYMGRDKMLDRPVAVKVMLKEYGSDASFVEKFKREAQAAAKLIHPNIAQIYSYGIADGMPYIAMELVAGGSLHQIMQNNPGATDIPRVMKICEQVAQALRCAADQGLVHGDVKPENVLLDSNGNAKLVDFGLAAMQKDTTEIWGTPYYIAPEKVRKEIVDYRADMYSLGGTLYHALTGVAPFEGDDATAVVKKRFESAPRKPSEVRPGISPQVDALVMKMLSLNKADRFPTFEALLEEYKKVLASGLSTTSTVTTTGSLSASKTGASKSASSTGGKKIVMKKGGSKRKFTVHAPTDKGEEGAAVSPMPIADDEEEGGSVGGKVALVVGGTIVAIAAVIGGLVWYTVADKKARAAALQAEIMSGIEKTRVAIADTRHAVVKFAEEFDNFAKRAEEECQKPTDELTKILSEDQAALLKPGPSAELLAAIAATNAAAMAEAMGGMTNVVAAAVSNMAEQVAGALQQAVATVATAVTASAPAANLPRFRPPREDETDPASPEHEAYLKEKAQWEAEQKAAAEAKAAAAAEAATPAEEAPAAAPAKPTQATVAVKEMNELWDRAYGCLAASIVIHAKCDKLVKEIDEAEKVTGNDKATMDKLSELQRNLKDKFDQIKASEEVAKVQKGIGFIKAKGAKLVAQTIEKLRLEKLEAYRKAKKEADEKAEKERLAQLAAEKERLIKEETELAQTKFDALVTSGSIRQLDWKNALRQLNFLKSGFKTAEGGIAVDAIIRRVNAMKSVQDIFIANIKGYVFTKGKIRNCKVIDVDEKEIKILKPDQNSTQKILWTKFYKEYNACLNELVSKYIVKGRENAKLDGSRISTLQRNEAMLGAAMSIRIICAENPTAIVRGEQLAKQAVKDFPSILKHAQEYLPDISFDDISEEE